MVFISYNFQPLIQANITKHNSENDLLLKSARKEK